MQYVRRRLANGMRVLLVPIPHLHSATATVYVRSGARFEPLALNGISHVIEHLLFRGTEHYPDSGAISHAADAMGADLNGATFPEYTEVVLNVHARHLARGLGILSELICRPLLDPAHFAKERRVILEEMAQNRDADSSGVNLDELSYKTMWPKQAFSFSSLGTRRALAHMRTGDIVAHYRRTFVPDHMVLCVAGNFRVDSVLRLVREHFGSLKGKGRLRERPVKRPPPGPRLGLHKHTSPVAHIRLCHEAFSYRDPRLVQMLVLCDILGGGTSSRLFIKLREEAGLVYDVFASPILFSDVGAMEILTSTTRARTVSTVRAILREIDLFLAEGVTARELDKIKDRVSSHMELMQDSPGDLAEWFGMRELLTAPRRLQTPAEQARKVLATTTGDLMKVAREIFRPEARSLVVLGQIDAGQARQIRAALRNGG